MALKVLDVEERGKISSTGCQKAEKIVQTYLNSIKHQKQAQPKEKYLKLLSENTSQNFKKETQITSVQTIQSEKKIFVKQSQQEAESFMKKLLKQTKRFKICKNLQNFERSKYKKKIKFKNLSNPNKDLLIQWNALSLVILMIGYEQQQKIIKSKQKKIKQNRYIFQAHMTLLTGMDLTQ